MEANHRNHKKEENLNSEKTPVPEALHIIADFRVGDCPNRKSKQILLRTKLNR